MILRSSNASARLRPRKNLSASGRAPRYWRMSLQRSWPTSGLRNLFQLVDLMYRRTPGRWSVPGKEAPPSGAFPGLSGGIGRGHHRGTSWREDLWNIAGCGWGTRGKVAHLGGVYESPWRRRGVARVANYRRIYAGVNCSWIVGKTGGGVGILRRSGGQIGVVRCVGDCQRRGNAGYGGRRAGKFLLCLEWWTNATTAARGSTLLFTTAPVRSILSGPRYVLYQSKIKSLFCMKLDYNAITTEYK